jgi:phosphorylase superfamily protein
VLLDSKTSTTARRLRTHYNDAVAIEMESAGVALAGHLNRSLPVLVVRGISDPADGTKGVADAAGWQQTAAENAAAFVMALVHDLTPDQLLPVGATSRSQPSSGGLGRPIFVSASDSERVTGWTAGRQVTVGERRYLLHERQLAEYTVPDTFVRHRRAQVSRPGARNEYGWLRQVEVPPAGAASARRAEEALAREHALLERLRSVRGMPRLSQFVKESSRSTLVVGWPVSRRLGTPCECLDVLLYHPGTALDRWRLFRLLTGLAGLCGTLAKLHELDLAHRQLAPDGIVALDDGTLVLRDLGLAGEEPRRGEGPADYQAPEQGNRGGGQVGPWTDVYQLAAVTYHLVAGRVPHPATPVPLSALAPDLPEAASRAVLNALGADTATRPDVRSLGSSFGEAAAAVEMSQQGF